MLLRCALPVFVVAFAMAAHAQSPKEKAVFSRAAIMAQGVDPSGRAVSTKDVPGKSEAELVQQRVDYLVARKVIRPQIVNPDGEAKKGEYPWMVAFEVRDPRTNNWYQFCAGTLIAEKVVLSAVHCNQFPGEWIRVAVDATVLDPKLGLHYYQVKAVATHPDFKRVELKLRNGGTLIGLANDLAIFVLYQDPPVAKLPLTTAATKMDVYSYGKGLAIGWGVRAQSTTNIPSLLYVEVPFVSDDECSRSYSPLANSMLCAGFRQGGKDTCQGDSGGPLVVMTKRNEFEQVGVVSFGEGCGLPERYGIYSSIPDGRDWLSKQIALPR